MKQEIYSEDWETCKRAVDRLAEINSDESTSILLDMLKSNDAQVRNLAAVGMRTTRNQKYLVPLLKRISQLGTKGQIGSLVYALENLDCSRNLFDIAYMNLNAGTNMEVKHSTTVILNEQSFILTQTELKDLKELLEKYHFTIDGFDVNFKMLQ